MKTQDFEHLNVWQEAHKFVLAVYRLTRTFPKDELFGLTSQFRRAAVSIAANIAEGYRKRGISDKLRFYNIAEGSADECRYYIILSRDLGYISPDAYGDLYEQTSRVSRLLNAYCSGIRNNLETNHNSAVKR